MAIPGWESNALVTLSQQGKLSNVNPLILEGIDAEESGGSGGGINPQGYGGWFGLGQSSSYPAGKTSPSLLLGTDPTSFNTQAIDAASAFESYMNQNNGNWQAAENEYQSGNPNTPSPGVAVIASYLGVANPASGTGSANSTAPNGSGGSNGNAPSNSVKSAINAEKLSGIGSVLQQVDDLLNPASPGVLGTIASLGTANITEIVVMVGSRIVFSAGFLGILFFGIKSFTGSSSNGSSSIIDAIQEQNRQALRSQALQQQQSNAIQRDILATQQNERHAKTIADRQSSRETSHSLSDKQSSRLANTLKERQAARSADAVKNPVRQQRADSATMNAKTNASAEARRVGKGAAEDIADAAILG